MLFNLRSGILAGAASALMFVVIHGFFISDIWFSLPVMLAAGAVCGLCLGWSYGLLFEVPSPGSWLRYNTLFLGMFALLGLFSLLIFEPVITLGELIAGGPPPGELIRRAMPVTLFTLVAMTAIISRLYARTWSHVGAILLTCALLVILLGLNISLMGLVYIPIRSLYLLGEMIGLIFALYLFYVLVFIVLDWRRMTTGSGQIEIHKGLSDG